MSFFIKCLNPNYVQGVVYALKDGKPHRLNHPKSLDRDWFVRPSAAAKAKREAEQLFALVAPSTRFRIERKT